MLEKRIPIPVAEAVARVMEYAYQGEIEKVSLIESYGRTLGEDFIADQDVPHFDRSPYDGFAIRAEDTKEASSSNPIQFEVIGEIEQALFYRRSESISSCPYYDRCRNSGRV